MRGDQQRRIKDPILRGLQVKDRDIAFQYQLLEENKQLKKLLGEVIEKYLAVLHQQGGNHAISIML